MFSIPRLLSDVELYFNDLGLIIQWSQFCVMVEESVKEMSMATSRFRSNHRGESASVEVLKRKDCTLAWKQGEKGSL